MLSFYAAKGGVGCSVTAAATAVLASREGPVLLVDLLGDQPALFGLDAASPGLADWFGADAPLPDALSRLEVPVDDRLSLLPLGRDPGHTTWLGSGNPEQYQTLARLLRLEGREIVVDVGTAADPARSILGASNAAILVSRLCYLATRAARPLLPPDDVVVIDEPGRALRPSDLAAVFGTAIDTVLPWDPAVARAVDAGLFAARLPRSLHRLRDLL